MTKEPPKLNRKKHVNLRLESSKLELLQNLYQTESITEIVNNLIDEKLTTHFRSKSEKPPITSIGGKTRIAKKILELIPEHQTYIELFGNTAAVLLRKSPSVVEIYNDINGQVVNFYRVLQKEPAALYRAAQSLPYSEEIYKEFRNNPLPNDPVEKALHFFYLNRCSVLGQKSGFRVSLPTPNQRNYAVSYQEEVKRFFAVAERFKNVQILNRDFAKVIRRYAEDDTAFFFVDPPYWSSKKNEMEYYDFNFGLEQHYELAMLLKKIQGRFLFCHYSEASINKMYTGCFRYDMQVPVSPARTTHLEKGTPQKPRKILCFFANYSLVDVKL